MKAVWNGATLAESDKTIVVEGNHYFPPSAVNRELFQPSDTHTTCHWKGEASYYTVAVDGKTNRDAAWFYPDPMPEAAEIKDYVAFWHGVKVED
jgi:uncharacterized protein (DUF427 family)